MDYRWATLCRGGRRREGHGSSRREAESIDRSPPAVARAPKTLDRRSVAGASNHFARWLDLLDQLPYASQRSLYRGRGPLILRLARAEFLCRSGLILRSH